MERETREYEYKEWEIMLCFKNSIVVIGFILNNIFYYIVE